VPKIVAWLVVFTVLLTPVVGVAAEISRSLLYDGQPVSTIFPDITDSATMGGVEERETFRTNLGLCEVWGESATVRVKIYDSALNELGFQDKQLRPYENIQINQVAKTVAGANRLSDGIVEVTVTGGGDRIGAYLSVVDNATGDPTFIAIAPQAPARG